MTVLLDVVLPKKKKSGTEKVLVFGFIFLYFLDFVA